MKVARYNWSHQLGDDLDDLLEDFRSMLVCGHYVGSREVEDFEAAFGSYVGCRHARGVNTGTDALILALLACGVGPGDEVVTQANTFHATVAAIRWARASPVLVDAEERGFGFDVSQLDSVITDRCRAIVPVHLYGKSAPMARVLAIAARRGVPVIEDAAQAHGAIYQGKRVGSLGTLGCFSFHPSKNLAAAGDGGAVVTDDEGLAADVRRRSQLGQVAQNEHVVIGLNSKLDALQARILSHKLPRLDKWNESRRRIAELYRERLAESDLGLQVVGDGEDHVYHLFPVRSSRRDELLAHLQAHGVDAVVRYPTPIHLQPAFSDQGWRRGQFPVAERLARELLSLPIRPDMTPAEVDHVAGAVQQFFGVSGR